MENVRSTVLVEGHEVSVVEVQDDEDGGYRIVVDGVARDELLKVPPTREEITRAVLRRGDAG